MNFRLRLALLFVTTLVAVQVFTAVLVYEVARRAVIAEGERQLAAGAEAVARQLDDISSRVAATIQAVFSLFPFVTIVRPADVFSSSKIGHTSSRSAEAPGRGNDQDVMTCVLQLLFRPLAPGEIPGIP